VSVYVINPYAFGIPEKFWVPTQFTLPITLSNFRVTTLGNTPVTVTWGDGTTQTLTSNVAVNKTFNASTSGIDTDSQATITQISCGTSLPKLGGTIDISDLPNLTNFTCSDNDVTAISGYEQHANLVGIFINRNLISGALPFLNLLANLVDFRFSNNLFSGSIPSLTNNTALQYFRAQFNLLSGDIPNLSNNPDLREFWCMNNQITGFAGGSVSTSLGNFQAQNNQLTSSAVNAILAAFVLANRTSGTRILYLDGTGNAAPTGQGLTDKSTLLTRGWDVRTN
jgi:hypothetical protein